MVTLYYKDNHFLEAGYKTIRDQETFDVVVTGFYVKVLRFVRRFRAFRPFIMPSFWAIYTYAADKQMQPTWSTKGEELIVSFSTHSEKKKY
jgi:hypothetical protein